MFSRVFIERPIFATVLSLVIVLAGVISAMNLPVEQYPSMTPVQVQVTAVYPGADAQTLSQSVAGPIEAQINGVDNMLYMTSSSSSNGQMNISVYFSLDTDPDIAQVQVQNRVSLALPQLPQAVQQNGVQVQKRSSSILMLVGVYSPDNRYNADYIANYANVYVLDAIKRIPGAGQASVMGSADQAMRIWLNPEKMANLGVTTGDVQQAVANQNKLFSAGQIGQAPNPPGTQLTYPVVTQNPYVEPSEYESIILRAQNNGAALVRLQDVAKAQLGLKQYLVDTALNKVPATFLAVYLAPGANALEVSKNVADTLERLKPTFPEGMDYKITLDTTDFVRISIEDVLHTLVEAIVLVIAVVYLFLQSVRATLIAIAAVFVALIGTFVGMLALGFTINLLTLFGMILAIGLVVDDAIVVVENVERLMHEQHLSAKDASLAAMNEISTALISVVLVLSSVFIPAAFLTGTTGQLYKQFAVTIVISVVLSGFVALTLTPALCGLFLKPGQMAQSGFFGWFNRLFASLTTRYGRGVRLTIERTTLALVLMGVMMGAIVMMFRALPSSFVPQEDQGYVLAGAILPDAASIRRTKEISEQLDAIFASNPEVDTRSAITGYNLLDSSFKTNTATFFVTLKPFEERTEPSQSADAVLQDIAKKARGIEGAFILPISPPAIPGLGATGGFQFWIQDIGNGSLAQLQQVTNQFLAKARQRPELTGLSSTFNAASTQLQADIDRDKAMLLGVPVQEAYGTLQTFLASSTVSQYFDQSRVWNVVLQAEDRFRDNPSWLMQFYTRNNVGNMVPLSAVMETKYAAGPDLVPHFNSFPAAQINGSAAPGYSSGDAIALMEQIAKETLPQGYSFAWSGQAFEEKQAGSTSTVAFALGLVIVFLILAAQFESWSLPCAVLTAVPFGLIGSLIFTMARGLENDVYFQIGLLVLIGLAAKNAVLIIEFAVELRHKGKGLIESAIEAGELRLRPIVMTSLAFILGTLPLMLASGAGANSRHSIGTGIVGGMIGATTLALFYVPMFYVIFERLAERGKKSPPPSGEGEVTPTAEPSPHAQPHADKETKGGQSNQEGQS
ncbi:efflux RND transporter permease subunit [Plesiomonas shigelloides]|uniref:efflux RND transporter permease subunit n=1 Tax=Plesiomonas shigelloides TaxID=703 RepID=UPI001261C6AE|nr:multidrug efflux RND transporter permease subunit [Plesiomonas shigelloides]KAB7675179.1 multidrug efflux RND transporter permease subunit [Plesiomonas shigelloides]